MKRQDAINEIIAMVGPFAWAKPRQWDHISDEELATQLRNARVYHQTHASRGDAGDETRGQARMDSAQRGDGRGISLPDTWDSEEQDAKARLLAHSRSMIAQPSVARVNRDGSTSTARANSDAAPEFDTDEDAARARMRAASAAASSRPSLRRSGK